MDLRKLKTLIDLVSESNISELEITEAEGKVRIVKAGTAVALAPLTPPPLAVATAPLAASVAPVASEAPVAPEGRVIKSPMVGTFYRAASPGAKPMIEIGENIKMAQPVCIIEAMKIMNEIEADCEGKLLRILCVNGQAVEYGQPMFVIE